MGKINVLSFAVANLIAAGEVVDRPSSVIKELLENAIDSGADRITVEIQNGGITYMRVTDNGCGISPEDLPVAIRRHATSKIKNAEDLDGIMTLGFRGEALAAIASVSKLRIISKMREAAMGAILESEAGNILGVTDRPASNGTTVIVENLFANVPARKKFLKKDVTEAMSVSAVVEKIALSRPDIFFKLIIDGNVKIETTGDSSLKNTVYAVFGREFASKLIETELTSDGITVKGFIGRPDNVRANRNYQNFFINGRYIKSRTAAAALEQAYTSYIASEKFPCCVLFLEIDHRLVDVNVHPAKLEVKFSNEKPVFETVYYAVRTALERNSSRPDIDVFSQKRRVTDAYVPVEDGRRESMKSRQVEAELYRNAMRTAPAPASQPIPVSQPNPIPQPIQPQNKGDRFAHVTAEEYRREYLGQSSKQPQNTAPVEAEYKPEIRSVSVQPIVEHKASKPEVQPIAAPKDEVVTIQPKVEYQLESIPVNTVATVENTEAEKQGESINYRIIGEAFNSYVIVEKGTQMLLIDKHAAHERIIFEQLKAGLKDISTTAQILMIPLEIMMTSDEIQAICDYKSEIEAIGFEFTAGRNTLSVTASPEGIEANYVFDMMLIMADRIKSGTGTAGLTKDIIFEKALYQASCKAAIKAGREYSYEQIKAIVDKLMLIPDITVCPHGRPVAMVIEKSKIDRQFERT